MIFFISLTLGIFLFTISSFFHLQFFNDFYSYYIAGNLIQYNLPIYGITNAFRLFAESNHLQFTYGTGYSYPPLLAQLISPLSLLSFPVAAAIWTSFQIFLYGLFISKIEKNPYMRKSVFFLPFLLLFGPALGSIINGQINIIILWCMYFYFYSNNDILRAVSLCFAGWIKVFPFLFLIKDILQKKFKFLVLFISLFILFFLFQSFSNSGIYVNEYFMNVLPKLQTEFDPYVTNQSFVGVVSRFIGVPFNTSIITIGEVIIFLIFAVITIHYGKKNTREVELLWLLTILLSAGKNSYWNMTPAIFIYLYFFKLNTPIEVKSRFVLAVSAVLNILFPYFILAFTKYPTLLSTVGGKICSSLGFFSLLILYYPLMKNIHFK